MYMTSLYFTTKSVEFESNVFVCSRISSFECYHHLLGHGESYIYFDSQAMSQFILSFFLCFVLFINDMSLIQLNQKLTKLCDFWAQKKRENYYFWAQKQLKWFSNISGPRNCFGSRNSTKLRDPLQGRRITNL